jgi:glyoxylase-like metal-dependent hydrolase (beta-lactamase superfamily II)
VTAAAVPDPRDRHAWIEPGAYPVAPGVWRIPTVLPLDGLKAVNIYALSDGSGLTLVDGGWALEAARDALVEGLAHIGAGLGDVRRFLVTHAHRDHYTNAVAVRREFGTPVLLGEGERRTVDVLTDPARPPSGQFALLARHGAGPVVDALRELGIRPPDDDWEQPDGWIADGERFEVGDRVLRAVHTPGHTRGHLVFADEAAGVLFAGDHVLPHITPSIGLEPEPSPDGLRAYLGALRLVRAMPDMLLLPAHGPAGGRTHPRIDELLAHHAQRLVEMGAALPAAGATAYEVATQVAWTSRHRKFADLDPLNQMFAVFETALHLELLTHQDVAVRTEVDGLRVYAPVPAAG